MIRFILIIAIFITSGKVANGQSTPDILGKTIFESFRNRDLASLDTLIASCSEVKMMYSFSDEASELFESPDFCEKFDYRTSRFITKCEKFMNDTVHYSIDWENATVENVEYYAKEIHIGIDTIEKSKSLYRHYLSIVFRSNETEFSMDFKGIKSLKDSWKLGSQIKLRKSEVE